MAIESPNEINRFGGLSLGESTHMVNDVSVFDAERHTNDGASDFQLFLQNERGRLTLPVWVDHVGSAGTVYITGNLETAGTSAPEVSRIPRITNGRKS